MIAKDTILKMIKESVQKTAPGATVILYGSYARGDYNEDSDIDLLILVDKEKITMADRTSVSYPLYDLGFDYGLVISPKVFSKQVWSGPKAQTPFFYEVKKEGVYL